MDIATLASQQLNDNSRGQLFFVVDCCSWPSAGFSIFGTPKPKQGLIFHLASNNKDL